MMHGREKSDSAIVATKPANKAGRLAAEWVERRVGTEGNVGQQSTCRAQNREKRVTGTGPRAANRKVRFTAKTRGRSRMPNVAPVEMWRSAPKVAARAE